MADGDTTTAQPPWQPPPFAIPGSSPNDSFMDRLSYAFSNPLVQGLMGMSQGFGQMAMPTRMPVPFGAALGNAMGGFGQGMSNAYTMRHQMLQNAEEQAAAPYDLAQKSMATQLGQATLPSKLAEAQLRQQSIDSVLQHFGGNKQALWEWINSGGVTALPGQGDTTTTTPATSGSPKPLPNNLGNVKTHDGNYVAYDTPQAGVAGIYSTLKSYGPGVTLHDAIPKYVGRGYGQTPPPGMITAEGYRDYVAQHAGLDPNQPIPFDDPAKMARLTRAIATIEKGPNVVGPMSDDVFNEGVKLGVGSGSPAPQAKTAPKGAVQRPAPTPATTVPTNIAPSMGPTGNQFAGPGVPTDTTPAQPSPAAASDADVIQKAIEARQGGAPSSGTQTAQAAPAPSPGQQSLAMPPGVMLTPAQALQQYQKLNHAAMLGDLTGLSIFGDPTMLRQAAQDFLKYAMAPSEATLKAMGEANVKLLTAGPIAGRAKEAELQKQLQYEPEIKRQEALATLGPELLKQGWQIDKDGKVTAVPGMQNDPKFIGEKASAEAAGKLQVELMGARALAIQKGLGATIDMSRPGSMVKVPQPDGTYKTYQNPVMQTVVNPDLSEGKVWISQPTDDMPPGTPPISTPVLGPDGKPMITKAAPLQEGFNKEQGENLSKEFASVRAQSASAKEQNYQFDNMRTAALSFNPNRFAEDLNTLRSYLIAIGQTWGLPDDKMKTLNEQVAGYTDFVKNAGMTLREAVKETGSRVGVQEYKMIGETLPSALTPRQAFLEVADQWQGLNDYKIAKEQFAKNYQAHPQDMQADWNAKISPTAFMINRMYQTQDGTRRFNELIDRLMAKGQAATVQQMLHEYNVANGYFHFDDPNSIFGRPKSVPGPAQVPQ